MGKFSTRGMLVGSIIFLLNMFDVICTYVLINNCGSSEASPIISYVLDFGGFPALLILKVVLSVIALFIFTKYWFLYRLARIGGYVVFVAYTLVAIYHIINLSFC